MRFRFWLNSLRHRGITQGAISKSRTRASVTRRQSGKISVVEHLEERVQLSAVSIQFDYRFDSTNFFDAPGTKALLQQAADSLTSRLSDSLTAITPSGTNTWEALIGGAGGSPISLSNLTVPADTLIVFVGAGNFSGELAVGAPGGISASGDDEWLDTVDARGQLGALEGPPTDFGPWGGSLWFNTATNWSFGGALSPTQFDFLSVATHELGHVLGFGTAPSFEALVAGSVFTGSHSVEEFGSSVPLADDVGHWAEGTVNGGGEAAMDPTLDAGAQKPFTELDYAALFDLGWSVSPTPPGFRISPTTGLVTSEAGLSAAFSIALASRPSGDVTIEVTSSDFTEGTPSVFSLTYTPADWNQPQTITVAGVDDATQDGDQAYTILLTLAEGSDESYSGVTLPAVTVTNLDNDHAGITVTPSSGLVTTEAGGEATFTVVLNSQPLSSVTIPLASSNSSEGAIFQNSLTFTPEDWNVPQQVVVTGRDDSVVDGDKAYTVMLSAAVSGDAAYDGLDVADVAATNRDNDHVGITVSPVSGLFTTEAGSAAMFAVVLNSQPSANVTIALSSSNTAEGTVAPVTVMFTPFNWNQPRAITVTGVNDDVADGDQTYSIVTSAASSSDPNYNGVNPSDVTLKNRDDDHVGFLLTQTSGLVTTEAGGAASFAMVLTSRPSTSVTVPISTSNAAEASASPASVVFTPENWNQPQTVTVTGVRDNRVDGNQPYTVITGAATSSDPAYNGLNPLDVSAFNLDSDAARIIVTPVSGLVTTEAGGTTQFNVILDSRPTATVTIAISSSNTAEGTVSPASLTFTPDNWNQAQTVTITGVDDRHVDGDKPYTIITAAAVSSDANYNGINPADVSVINRDSDTAGISVSPLSLIVTTEVGGTADITVVLESPPTSEVTIPVSSTNSAEGTVSVTSVVFTSSNWNIPKKITVRGVDDGIADGSQSYLIVLGAAESSDAKYSGLDADDVPVLNIDNDRAAFVVSHNDPLTTTENGGSVELRVVLASQPQSAVTIPVTSSNTDEGTVSPDALTFTPDDWNVPQFVSVTGVHDDVDDGDVEYLVTFGSTTSGDSQYDHLPVQKFNITNINGDLAGVSTNIWDVLLTSEFGNAQAFDVQLTARPTATVTVSVRTSNSDEGVVSPSSLTFTPDDWNIPQSVTVTGVNDFRADGDRPYKVIITVAAGMDDAFNNVSPLEFDALNQDDDPPGFSITASPEGISTEAGQTATFNVVMNSQPTAPVTITLSSSNPAAGIVSPTTLVFTPEDWNQPQTVTVIGAPGDVIDSGSAYEIILSAATSADPTYGGLNPPDVPAVNFDQVPANLVRRMDRAYNPNADYHFFTTSPFEFANAVAHGYLDESTNRPGYSVLKEARAGAIPIHRMYNLTTGRHYYTINDSERNVLVSLGWRYEKDEGFMYTAQAPGASEIFRLYNKNSGVHLYTENAAIKDAILAQFKGIWVQHSSLGFAYATDSHGQMSPATRAAVARTLAAVSADLVASAPSITAAAVSLPVVTSNDNSSREEVSNSVEVNGVAADSESRAATTVDAGPSVTSSDEKSTATAKDDKADPMPSSLDVVFASVSQSALDDF